ncbi:hypothetical protein NEUTE1DRAFT_81805 [Neurospora tetrasperma FGSC 2508]|uniref:Protein FAF1 n=1 Tax=Neurospora tetrasperma (strain FGSC 2508 / ATCC MYA-4615 / P0657) TaxID=510951 RepID=F8MMH6_NEUT8|nr:uncharacterized protein NEUTE1DRAFT_81805 [Neurospora tetrasperma FGSC 2508]EGO57850.1 hypothetical protein NEUTE1DRAFT_81805 [Neurospora tetrasperma FGSC 2508]EGZ71868.1 hypothetical protein NEUTE2DRAFT_89522 [Neurospora tetrasperma FGSC 2509]
MPSATLLGKRKSIAAQPEAKKKKRVAEDLEVKRKKQKLAKKEEKPVKKADEEEEEEQQDISDALSVFQRAFEARFKSIASASATTTTTKVEKSKSTKNKTRKAQEDGDGVGDDFHEDQILEDDDAVDSGSEDDFSGLEDEEDYSGSDSEEEEKDDEDAPKVMVVDYSKDPSKVDTSKMSKKELKAYLSSKPPNAILDSNSQTNGTKAKKDKDGEGEDSAAFLANDLALQRLIAESHILSAAGGNASHYLSSAAAETDKNTRAFAEGRIRKKTTDMRMQALGAKGSVLEQEKMPMNMRKGIKKASETYEQKRRREARENGIILEKASGKGKGNVKKRSGGDRPVDMPGIGRMRGAQLTISSREIRSMENSGPVGRGGRGMGGKAKGGHRKRR